MSRSQCRRRLVGAALVLGASIAVPLSAPVPAQAYCASSLEWGQNELDTKAGSNVPATWINTLQASANEWNNISGANWTIDWAPSVPSDFVFRYSTPSGGFGGAPAFTALNTVGTTVIAGDIYYNHNFTWSLNGNMNQSNMVADVRTISVHELGHQLVLNHPKSCPLPYSPAELASAMNPNWNQKWHTNGDDEAGAAFLK